MCRVYKHAPTVLTEDGVRSGPSQPSGLLDMLESSIAEANERLAIVRREERAASGVAMAVVKRSATADGQRAANQAVVNYT